MMGADWASLQAEILGRLDIRAECEALGVEFTAREPSAKGWLACRAIDREDSNPSAAICVGGDNGALGRYTDCGSDRKMSFFELSAELGPWADWRAARTHYAEKVGAELPKRRTKRKKKGHNEPPRNKLTVAIDTQLRLNPVAAACSRGPEYFTKLCSEAGCYCTDQEEIQRHLWRRWSAEYAAAKNLDADAVCAALQSAGAILAAWVGRHGVFAIPGHRPDAPDHPTAMILLQANGEPFPASNTLPERKQHTVAGSVDSLIVPGGWQALAAAHTCVLLEGPTDALALHPKLPEGYVVVTNTHGAGSFDESLCPAVAGKRVWVVMDADKAGEGGAGVRCRALSRARYKVKEVRRLRLPFELADSHGKDVRDWLQLGASFDDLRTLANDAEKIEIEKPMVTLPGLDQPITQPAAQLGELLAKNRGHYVRDFSVVKLVNDASGKPVLRSPSSNELASDFEKVASLHKYSKGNEGPVLELTACSAQTAALIAACEAFRSALSQITTVSACPVLFETGGELIEATGYCPQARVYAFGSPADARTLADAVSLLRSLLEEYRFATPSDRSRALAALITPALIHGGVLGARAPVTLLEADDSQAGKGYFHKLTAAIYGGNVRAVTQDKGRGVGSMDERISDQLLDGASMISLDNVRGAIDSPFLESILTEDFAHCRALRRSGNVDVRQVYFAITSNGAKFATSDLPNRCSCVRIVKRAGHSYRQFPEGDLLSHVRANQPKFLGAVFKIVREWHGRGKPRENDLRHDFRQWAQALDWIVRHLLDEAPLLDGHDEARDRMTNPALSWLRELALLVHRERTRDRPANEPTLWLQTHDLLNLIEADGGVPVPGLKDGDDLENDATRSHVLRQMGRWLARCFQEGNACRIDGMTIERKEFEEDKRRTRFRYRFGVPASTEDASGAVERNAGSFRAQCGSDTGAGDDSTAERTENGEPPASVPALAPHSAPHKNPEDPALPASESSNRAGRAESNGPTSVGAQTMDTNAGMGEEHYLI